MSYQSYLLTLCSLYQFLALYQSFVVLSNICHLLAPCYLFTFYVIFSSYKFTYCTHDKQLPFLSYRAHVLCANVPFLLTRSLWPLCHSALGGGSRHGWGFSLRTSITLYTSSYGYNPWYSIEQFHMPCGLLIK